MTTDFLKSLRSDFAAGLVAFLVAIPLCLGIALASQAPLFSGLVAGVLGGILVGFLSGSHTSVSGPAAGLAAVVAAQITALGSYETFLLAVFLAGIIQIVLGVAQAGFLSSFVPSSVVKGLLAAIGILLILKQIPHLLGDDNDPEGDFAFNQPDNENTFSELLHILSEYHLGAATIGILSILFLVSWDRVKFLKYSPVPSPLLVVLLGIGLGRLFESLAGPWAIQDNHYVQVPVPESLAGFADLLRWPNWSSWNNPKVYLAAVTIAAVASLETLLNLQAVDKIDPAQRTSPASRELWAQGIGNTVSGLLGGLPITSVIVRSSVAVNAGSKTKLAAIIHGVLLLLSVLLLPTLLNLIPLSALAAILIVTGFKLANPALLRQMWKEGPYQFIPFAITVLAIVFTDMLVGIMLGLVTSVSFILWRNARRPVQRTLEKRPTGEVHRLSLANHVSFLNRAGILQVFESIPEGGHILIDAHQTDYIDPDIVDLIRSFKDQVGPARGIQVSLSGFASHFRIDNDSAIHEESTAALQQSLSPAEVLQILKDGHERFRRGERLPRNIAQQVNATSSGQHPLAVVLSCIDSRAPVEIIFDMGVGDVFSVRIAGNVPSVDVLGSMEYSCAVAGAKLLLVMGHTRCGAVKAAVGLHGKSAHELEMSDCPNLVNIVGDIKQSVILPEGTSFDSLSESEQLDFVDECARLNVLYAVNAIRSESATLARLEREGKIIILGARYDVASGNIEFMQ